MNIYVMHLPGLKKVHRQTVTIRKALFGWWCAFEKSLFAPSVLGNPLHEAWTADGEPLERLTPAQFLQANAMHTSVIPHGRSR